MNRGQISIEFLIVMGLAVVMLVVLLAVGANQLEESATQRDLNEVLDLAHTTQQELLTAASVQDGYRRTFTLPAKVGNKPYNISLANASAYSVVTFTTAKRRYSVRTPLCNGGLQPGANSITKDNGLISCNQ